jgi:hypothetical protein
MMDNVVTLVVMDAKLEAASWFVPRWPTAARRWSKFQNSVDERTDDGADEEGEFEDMGTEDRS